METAIEYTPSYFESRVDDAISANDRPAAARLANQMVHQNPISVAICSAKLRQAFGDEIFTIQQQQSGPAGIDDFRRAALIEFLKRFCDIGEDYRVECRLLFSAFTQWAQLRVSQDFLSRELLARGFQQTRCCRDEEGRQVLAWSGLKFKETVLCVRD